MGVRVKQSRQRSFNCSLFRPDANGSTSWGERSWGQRSWGKWQHKNNQNSFVKQKLNEEKKKKSDQVPAMLNDEA